MLAGVATAVLIVGALLWRSADDAADPSGTTVLGGGVSHVHGLGINPADGTLYAATHNGMFRVPDEEQPSRVGDLFQDTMGFTVVGADHFLGSGHPDLRDEKMFKEGRPPLLGLIESTDGGVTWESRSLLGEADFHGLVAAHGKVYGYDSTGDRFMVSDDKKTWDLRSTPQLVTFAIDPGNPEGVIAATAEGLVRSLDGGRTWETVEGPQILFLSWEEGTGMWGAGPEGGVFFNESGRGAWERRGDLPGPPQALLVSDGILYSAADVDGATAIYQSDDGGGNWELLYMEDPAVD